MPKRLVGEIQNHPQRREIEKLALQAQAYKGKRSDGTLSFQQICDRFNIKRDNLRYHLRRNVTSERAKELTLEIAREKTAALDAVVDKEEIDIQSGMKKIIREIDSILARAKTARDDQLALTSLRDMRGTLMDMARLFGKLQNHTTLHVEIGETPEWMRLKHILIDVFKQHPDALLTFQQRTRNLKLISEDQERSVLDHT